MAKGENTSKDPRRRVGLDAIKHRLGIFPEGHTPSSDELYSAGYRPTGESSTHSQWTHPTGRTYLLSHKEAARIANERFAASGNAPLPPVDMGKFMSGMVMGLAGGHAQVGTPQYDIVAHPDEDK